MKSRNLSSCKKRTREISRPKNERQNGVGTLNFSLYLEWCCFNMDKKHSQLIS